MLILLKAHQSKPQPYLSSEKTDRLSLQCLAQSNNKCKSSIHFTNIC